MRTKVFDCVEMKRRAAERIFEATKNLTMEQEIDYWRRRSEEFRREQERLVRQQPPSPNSRGNQE